MADYVINVLPENWFKIEFIGYIKIRGNRFWITVYHYGLIATFSSGQHPVNTTIIKFYSLTNTVWSRAQHHYFFPVGYKAVILGKWLSSGNFHFVFKGGIIIRCLGLEFGSTGI